MTAPTQAAAVARRPELSPFVLNVLVATYLIAICNTTFWGHLFRIFDGRPVTAVVFAGAVWALMLLVVSILAVRRAQKLLIGPWPHRLSIDTSKLGDFDYGPHSMVPLQKEAIRWFDYWLKGKPRLENALAICLDYSVAKGGVLVACRLTEKKGKLITTFVT